VGPITVTRFGAGGGTIEWASDFFLYAPGTIDWWGDVVIRLNRTSAVFGCGSPEGNQLTTLRTWNSAQNTVQSSRNFYLHHDTFEQSFCPVNLRMEYVSGGIRFPDYYLLVTA
jgi:hypothetical protein